MWEQIKPPARPRMNTLVTMKDGKLSNSLTFKCHHKYLIVDNQTPYLTQVVVGELSCPQGRTSLTVEANQKINLPLPDTELTCTIAAPGWVDINVNS